MNILLVIEQYQKQLKIVKKQIKDMEQGKIPADLRKYTQLKQMKGEMQASIRQMQKYIKNRKDDFKMGVIEKMMEIMRPANTEPKTNNDDSDGADQAEAKEENASDRPKAQEPDIEIAEQNHASAEDEKSYSQEEFDRVLEERKKIWEEERFASLSQDSQIEELKKELLKRDLKEKVLSRLEEAKLPSGVADFVQYTDEAGTMENLESVIATISGLVQEGVKNRLRGRSPEGIGKSSGNYLNLASSEEPFAKAFKEAMKK